ncbi:MAG: carboxypeptidase regulatory-like domain-containing protein [Anaerolineae bacterium]|nr:carboxypeptidase regulatory-like domain-containing protein [Anaerolineae bacterium]
MIRINRNAFLFTGSVLVVVAFIYSVHATLDWLEYDFDLPVPDCLMSTETVQGTVKDEQNNPIAHARIEIKGHRLVCDKAVRFPISTTDVIGVFQTSKQVYSPVVRDRNGSTVEPTRQSQLLRLGGVYEVVVTADGYQPFYKTDLTDEEVFGSLNIILKRR